jgi:hypothetical protein
MVLLDSLAFQGNIRDRECVCWSGLGKVLRTASLVKSIARMFIRPLSDGKDYKNVTKRDQEQNRIKGVHLYCRSITASLKPLYRGWAIQLQWALSPFKMTRFLN